MKYLLIFILAIGGGLIGGYFSPLSQTQDSNNLGATSARTTITSPWTFQATTTMANVTVTTTNAATSTVQAGCFQGVATSTATPIHLEFSTTTALAGYPSGTAQQGAVSWKYGKCPLI